MNEQMQKLVKQEFTVPATSYIAKLLEKVPRSHRVEALKWLANEVIGAVGHAKEVDAKHKQAVQQ